MQTSRGNSHTQIRLYSVDAASYGNTRGLATFRQASSQDEYNSIGVETYICRFSWYIRYQAFIPNHWETDTWFPGDYAGYVRQPDSIMLTCFIEKVKAFFTTKTYTRLNPQAKAWGLGGKIDKRTCIAYDWVFLHSQNPLSLSSSAVPSGESP